MTHRVLRGGGRHVIGRSGWSSRLHIVAAAFFAVLCFFVPRSQGDIILLSDNRHVNVSALAAALEGKMSSSDSDVAAPFAEFHGNKHAHAQWMDTLPPNAEADCNADAMQDSTLSVSALDVTSFVSVDGGGNFAGGGQAINADALSFFQVSFSVAAPIVFNLSLFDARGYVTGVGSTYDHSVDLSSNISGSILHVGVTGEEEMFFTGLLQPDQTYTLVLSQHANTIIPAPMGSHVQNTLEAHMTFADVPEPSVFVSLLVGLGLLVVVRTKFARAIPCAVRASGLPVSRVVRVARLRSKRQPPAAAARW